MNGSANPEPAVHTVFLSIGSNIQPNHNIPRAILFLREIDSRLVLSTPYETRAVGSDGPNFINLSVRLVTHLDARQFKEATIGDIETRLGRMRSTNKNSPRTIDLDILVFDGQILDTTLWERTHLAVPLAELLPSLPHPVTGETLLVVALRLGQMDPAIPRPDLLAETGRPAV